GDQHIRKRQEAHEHVVLNDVGRVVLEKQLGFLFIDVQSQVADSPGLEPRNDYLSIDEGPAAGVDQHRAAFHPLDRGLVDHVVGLRRQRAMQRNDVGGRVELFQGNVRSQVSAFLILEDVVEENAAAKAAENAGGDSSDLARADDAGRLAVHV